MSEQPALSNEAQIKEVFDLMLPLISPDESEITKVKEISEEFLELINSKLKYAHAIVGGSYAKNTWLKNIKDIDVFVQFNYDQYQGKNNELTAVLEEVIKRTPEIQEYDRVHGSRDYFQLTYKGIFFELIPILQINHSDEAQNITDISPLHAEWVSKYPEYSSDIRLTKAFAKANRIYGAESYIKGFSGYSLEILIIHFKGLANFLRTASTWDENEKQVVIDPEKYHEDPLKELNESKLTSPLVLIDPVEAGRNVSAALGAEKFSKLIKTAKEFVQDPNEGYFTKTLFTDEYFKALSGENQLFKLKLNLPEGKEDVIGCKAMKVVECLEREITTAGFTITNLEWEYDKKQTAHAWIIIKPQILDETYEWIGPPVKAKTHAEHFKEKHEKQNNPVNEIDGRLIATVTRENRTPKELLNFLIKSEYITERTTSVQLDDIKEE